MRLVSNDDFCQCHLHRLEKHSFLTSRSSTALQGLPEVAVLAAGTYLILDRIDQDEAPLI